MNWPEKIPGGAFSEDERRKVRVIIQEYERRRWIKSMIKATLISATLLASALGAVKGWWSDIAAMVKK